MHALDVQVSQDGAAGFGLLGAGTADRENLYVSQRHVLAGSGHLRHTQLRQVLDGKQ